MNIDRTNQHLFLSDKARWQAVVQRTPEADGTFVYGVATTGIYCRPHCASRRPNRENVRFFDTPQSAQRAGFRPCTRCNPASATPVNDHLDVMVAICRMIEEAQVPPLLEELAAAANLSPSHFHRLFKKTVGVTPKQYFMQSRAQDVRSSLQQERTVTDAIYSAGFNSSSQFYNRSTAMLGMKPSEFQSGGQGRRIHYAIRESFLGWLLVAATDRGICTIDLADAPETLEERLLATFPEADVERDRNFAALLDEVLAFLEAPQRGLELPLDIQGTAFQRRVWQALQQIPPGTTATYAEIAERVGKPTAARAVAQACASNKIAVAIPCHRIVRSNGELGGYRWGLHRKQLLLEREAQSPA